MMIRYIHGSEDSLDLDVFYVFDFLPDINECKRFCSEDDTENRNIIVVKDGIVADCFIGTIDEINNGLIDTYSLHKQDYPLIVEKRLERDIIMKSIRAVRGILSLISRTEYRKEVKYALKNNWEDRLRCLESIDYSSIDFSSTDKQLDELHIKKVIAFQIGQTLGLLEGKEYYTKSTVVRAYPELEPFLYRREGDMKTLDDYIKLLVRKLRKMKTKRVGDRIVLFVDENKKIDLTHETYLD